MIKSCNLSTSFSRDISSTQQPSKRLIYRTIRWIDNLYINIYEVTLARWQNRSLAHIPFNNNLAAIHGQNPPSESTGIQPQVRSNPASQGPTGSTDCAPESGPPILVRVMVEPVTRQETYLPMSLWQTSPPQSNCRS